MTNSNQTQVFEKSAVIHLDFRQWSGSVVFDRADFKGEVPPDQVTATRGQKRLVDPKCLREFANIKERAQTVLNDYGVPFLKGYLVSLERLGDVTAELNKLRDEYNSKRDKFVEKLPEMLEAWATANGAFADNLRQRFPTRDDVASRIHADYSVTKVAPVPGCEQQLTTNGLAGELLRDIQSRARKLLEGALERGEATQRVRGAVVKMIDKISSLAYLNTTYMRVVNHFRDLLVRLPKQGTITDNAFVVFTTGMNMVASDELLVGILNGSNALGTALQRVTTPAASAPKIAASPIEPVAAPAVEPKAEHEQTAPQSELDFDLDKDMADFFGDAPANESHRKLEAGPAKEPAAPAIIDSEEDWEMYGEVPPPPPAALF